MSYNIGDKIPVRGLFYTMSGEITKKDENGVLIVYVPDVDMSFKFNQFDHVLETFNEESVS